MFPWNFTDKKWKSCWKFTNVAFHDSLCSDNLFSVPFYIYFFLNTKWSRINRANQSNVQNSCHWRTISIFLSDQNNKRDYVIFWKNALFFPPLFSSTVLTFDLCNFQYFICNLIGYPYCLKKEEKLLWWRMLICMGPFIYCLNTFLGIMEPSLSHLSMFLVLKVSKNCHFLTPLPTRSAYVIYEGSLWCICKFYTFISC